MLLGILSLQRGENPNRVRDQLSAFEMRSARWDEVIVPQQEWDTVQENHSSSGFENSRPGIQHALWGEEFNP